MYKVYSFVMSFKKPFKNSNDIMFPTNIKHNFVKDNATVCYAFKPSLSTSF